MKSFKSILLIFVVAGAANAADTTTTKFISLDACKTYFSKSVTAVAGQTADTYCADKIMSLTEACTATKISEYVTANKLTAFTDLTNTEQVNLKSKFSYQCQLTAQQEAAKATQTAAATKTVSNSSGTNAAIAAAAVAGTAAAVNAASNASNASKLQNAQMATQLAQQGVKITENIDKSTAAANKTTPAPNNSGGNNTSSTANAGSVSDGPNVKPSTLTTSDPQTTVSAASDNGDKYSLTGGTKVKLGGETSDASASAGGVTQMTQQQIEQAAQSGSSEQIAPIVKAGENAQAQITAAGRDVSSGVSSELTPKVNAIDSASQVEAGASAISKTEISTSANSVSAKVLAQAQSTIQAAFGLATPAALTQTAASLQTLNAQVQKYINTTKVACINSAENASFLCVEGTSPGAIAAKELMNAAGPILSIISSAQKTCSSTAKVTRLVNLGLTAATGVCITSKAVCSSACATAATDLKTILAAIAKLQGTMSAEAVGLSSPCVISMNSAPYCIPLEKNFPLITEKLNTLTGILNPESSPAPMGTTGSIVAKCGSFAKDIARFAVQVLGTYAAQQNAQKCADQLASSGAAAANVTTQQYCEKSENVSSQLCVCQKNSMAAGCPGAVVATTKTSDSNNETGTNIKSVGGNAAFAGGFGNGVKAPGFGVGKLGTGTNGSGFAIGQSGDPSAATNGSGSGGGGAGGANGGLGAAPASDPSNPVAKKDAEEKKKWGFGSFGGMAGSIFGGSGSSSNGANGKSGALTAKDQAGIQRQIASEKVSAEVSTASGKSNWEKIRNMYMLKESSFILGQ